MLLLQQLEDLALPLAQELRHVLLGFGENDVPEGRIRRSAAVDLADNIHEFIHQGRDESVHVWCVVSLAIKELAQSGSYRRLCILSHVENVILVGDGLETHVELGRSEVALAFDLVHLLVVVHGRVNSMQERLEAIGVLVELDPVGAVHGLFELAVEELSEQLRSVA
jgi:hypothetical protein